MHHTSGSLFHTNVDSSSGANAENAFQECWCICTKNADPLVALLQQVVREASRSVGGFLIRSSKGLAICRLVVDRNSL
jgi:hypothetical protein